ncbi:thioredoxin family protein [Aquibacillus sediminis]|uniref:thioredoxin family protein n=1 Tax=Aquibacillus sediminis TaxID=2574734 RepID=UPI0011098B71|nr:thioredoxin family protein [Aquibacillus sediminis]
MKKMIIFAVILIVLFGALGFVVNYQNQQQSEGNPYGKDSLHSATIDQLDDPNYQNQILPDELDEKIASGEAITVYFYDPTCPHCQQTTPEVVPMTDDLGVELKKLNVLEFEDAWNTYQIEATPTIVHFEDGQEAARIRGGIGADLERQAEFEAFFEDNVLEE